jgi:hypothetical protein
MTSSHTTVETLRNKFAALLSEVQDEMHNARESGNMSKAFDIASSMTWFFQGWMTGMTKSFATSDDYAKDEYYNTQFAELNIILESMKVKFDELNAEAIRKARAS